MPSAVIHKPCDDDERHQFTRDVDSVNPLAVTPLRFRAVFALADTRFAAADPSTRRRADWGAKTPGRTDMWA